MAWTSAVTILCPSSTSRGFVLLFAFRGGEIRETRTYTMEEVTLQHIFTTATLEKLHKQEFCAPKSTPNSMYITYVHISCFHLQGL